MFLNAMLRFLISTIIVSLVLLVAVAAIGPMTISSDTIVKFINERATLASGYSIKASGPASFRVLPSLSVYMDSLAVTEPEKKQPSYQFSKLNVKVHWSSLFSSGIHATLSTLANETPLEIEVLLKPESAQNWNTLYAEMQLQEPARAFLSTDIIRDDAHIALQNLALEMPASKGKGEVTITTSEQEKQSIKGGLNFTVLDIEELQQVGAALALLGQTQAAAAPAKKSSAHASDAQAISLPDLSALALDFSIRAEDLRARGSSWGKAGIFAKNSGNKIQLTLEEIKAYAGSIKAALTVAPEGNGINAALDATATGLDVGTILHDMKTTAPVNGRLNATISATAHGTTVENLQESIQGTVNVSLKEGVLQGYNTKALADLEDEKLVAKLIQPDAVTPLSSASAQFNITNGVVRVEDMSVAAPNITVDATGTYHIAGGALNFMLTPTIKSTALEVRAPVKVQGTVDEPAIALQLQARGTYAGTPVDAKADIANLQLAKDMAKEASRAHATVQLAQPLEAVLASDVVAQGERISLPNLTAQFPQAKAKITAAVEKSGDIISASNLVLQAPRSQGKGQFKSEPKGEGRAITAALEFTSLDMDELKAMLGGGAVASGVASPARAQSDEPWSREPFDLEALRSGQADISLSTDKLFVGGKQANRIVLNIALRDGRLQGQLKEAQLYGGALAGNFLLDASAAQSTPHVTLALNSDKVDVGQVLALFTGVDRLSGVGALTVSLSAQGNSELAMVQTLTGDGKFSLQDGMIHGIDTAGMISNNPQQIINSFNNPNAQTPIKEMNGSFTVKDGTLHNSDLVAVVPNGAVRGYGEIALPSMQIQYQLTPEVSNNKGALVVPVAIVGDVRNPHYKPDMSKLAELGLDKLAKDNKEVKKITDKLDSLGIPGLKEGLLKGVLGGGANIPGKPVEQKPAPAAPVPSTQQEQPIPAQPQSQLPASMH